MSNFSFKNAICTNKQQSEELIKLGINPLTADMFLDNEVDDSDNNYYQSKVIEQWMDIQTVPDMYVPAWSLSRLNEMMPVIKGLSGNHFTAWLLKDENGYKISYKCYIDSAMIGTHYYDNPIDAYIDMVSWAIKEGYFDKNYLIKK